MSLQIGQRVYVDTEPATVVAIEEPGIYTLRFEDGPDVQGVWVGEIDTETVGEADAKAQQIADRYVRQTHPECFTNAGIEYSDDPDIAVCRQTDACLCSECMRRKFHQHPQYEPDNCPRCGTAQRRLPPR